MHPHEATGAPNPEPGMAAAVMAATPSTFDIPPPQSRSSAAPARQILDAVTRFRKMGCRNVSLTLTRSTDTILDVQAMLTLAGLASDVQPAGGGCSRLVLRS
ncbi:hypothetical protein [Nitrospirillum viridazoti]|uniref:Uncharacterized protein n=2 Tax=Azospirillaceae TaxID=2829815 RepID=A0A560G0J1_9PROT|nr:hypothetical protein [Nitrospirillum amazonense]TWB23895.1 hypothetical protein FBZ88_11366 [Nitrospirillum amazonense]TWB27415.1 hypothetical protein FBZ91_13337 [Nitrospirillum amazonense]TWB51007.1 hypothetical protein FBZ92_122102 [Nitrospirillum amazonense]